jgi:hypothetical protein
MLGLRRPDFDNLQDGKLESRPRTSEKEEVR